MASRLTIEIETKSIVKKSACHNSYAKTQEMMRVFSAHEHCMNEFILVTIRSTFPEEGAMAKINSARIVLEAI
jgi:hypothetical protein